MLVTSRPVPPLDSVRLGQIAISAAPQPARPPKEVWINKPEETPIIAEGTHWDVNPQCLRVVDKLRAAPQGQNGRLEITRRAY